MWSTVNDIASSFLQKNKCTVLFQIMALREAMFCKSGSFYGFLLATSLTVFGRLGRPFEEPGRSGLAAALSSSVSLIFSFESY